MLEMSEQPLVNMRVGAVCGGVHTVGVAVAS